MDASSVSLARSTARCESARRRFGTTLRSSRSTRDLHVDLIDVFANLEQFRPEADASWRELAGHVIFKRTPELRNKRMWGIDNDAYAFDADKALDLQRKWAPHDVRRAVAYSVCKSSTDFRDSFSMLTDGRLDDFDMSNLVVAGGAVLGALLFQPQPIKHNSRHAANAGWNQSASTDSVARQREAFFQRRGFDESDLDIFMCGLTQAEADAKIAALYAHLQTFGDTTVVRTKLAVTFLQDHPRRVIQVVLRLYKSVAEVLAGFDVDACCVAYDGERVWATPRAKRALNGMVNVVDPSRQSLTYESRLFKYAVRGFVACVPGFDPSRIHMSLFDREVCQPSHVPGASRAHMLTPRERVCVFRLVRCTAWHAFSCSSGSWTRARSSTSRAAFTGASTTASRALDASGVARLRSIR